MTLKERIREELTAAMKSKDELKLSTLRLLTSSIKNKEIEERKELTDEAVMNVLSTAAKQRRDSIEQFEKAGRTDLAVKEAAELAILQTYMPTQLSEAEIEQIVKETMVEAEATTAKEMGKLMKALMPKTKGKADGKLVNEVVKRLLG